MLVALTVWDTHEAARTFAGDYVRLLARKHRLPSPTPADALATWLTDGRAFAVEQRGTLALVIEGAPASEATGEAFPSGRGCSWRWRSPR